ncbi:family 71 glycoside hydrolase [Melampsora larici-populina 98AG31]|uniref:Family 71 glycoside hydrolase n=1 Tax=Melampsora larici-populina (strain 98AG31 / pathotype 3-4-7) TaxID=747676 RepID=F4RJ30_MELLP|nr:family 71 glycoside hydrolase [Melampsora larici-populina 98AG31]EGG07663.1 family 71 glycoside hydrolase [Melampsora larici-populina 98AG31]
MVGYTTLKILYFSLLFSIISGSFVRMVKQNHRLGLRSDVSLESSMDNVDLDIRVIETPRQSSLSSLNRFSRRKSPEKRFVFAHVVQGNSQFYQADDWKEDMELAKQSGIDAFAINIGRDITNERQIPLAYDVADQLDFSLFLSFDMSYYGQPGSSKDVIKLIRTFAHRQSQFKYQGKPLVSTFSGEVPGTYLDNNPDYNAAWDALKKNLGFSIYFLPCWTGANPSSVPTIDGLLSWDAWSSYSESPDERNRLALHKFGKQYAAPISPLFFKHLEHGAGGNYVYSSDDFLVIEKYIQLIQSPPAFIELLTWNDYGEAHYLKDPRKNANLPKGVVSAHDYVNGFSHEPLLHMLSYFNLWYKDGSRPKLEKSKLYLWHRPHPKSVTATDDPLSIPKSSNESQDNLYILLMVKSRSNLNKMIINSGSKKYTKHLKEHLSRHEDTIIRITSPFHCGKDQSIQLFDDHDDQEILNFKGLAINSKPEKYNFNYWSGMTTF